MGQLTYWVADWNLSRDQAAQLLGGDVDDMADLIGSNAPRDLPDLEKTSIRKVGVYVTGSPDIVWPAAIIHEYEARGFAVVLIDQRNGPAAPSAVADLEGGAKTVQEAVTEAWAAIGAGRDYSIYVDQSGLPAVERAWLSAGHPPGRIAAYQYASPSSNPNTELSPGVTLRDANADLSVTLKDWHPVPGSVSHVRRAVVTYDKQSDGWAIRPGVRMVNPPGYHSTVTIDLDAGPGWSIKPGVG